MTVAYLCMTCLLGADAPDEPGLRARALLSLGDLTRVGRVLARSERGEPITVGVIGGSITAGASATEERLRYGNRIADWWRARFPGSEVGFVNAGIGATGSNYGALRAQRDLLSRKPDLVVVEYAVNDPNTEGAAETVEGLVRQVLSQPNEPAVVLMFMMARSADGAGNAQEQLSRVGAHYGLPMLSFRDALWPEIAAERLAWESVMADVVHPSDRGHEYAASFVTELLERAIAQGAPADEPLAELPEPLISDRFARVRLYEAPDLVPVSNEGWSLDAANACWRAETPGSVVEFEVTGETVLLMEYHVRGPMGMARVEVDGVLPMVRDAWFDQTWGGWRCTTELARGLGPGPHRVRLTLLEEKHAESTGTQFQLLGLGTAGVE